jgi:hypothetical protein
MKKMSFEEGIVLQAKSNRRDGESFSFFVLLLRIV